MDLFRDTKLIWLYASDNASRTTCGRPNGQVIVTQVKNSTQSIPCPQTRSCRARSCHLFSGSSLRTAMASCVPFHPRIPAALRGSYKLL